MTVEIAQARMLRLSLLRLGLVVRIVSIVSIVSIVPITSMGFSCR